MTRGPLTPEGLRVCEQLCSTCVFRPGNLMQLQPGRLAGMVRDSVAADSAISCHKTLGGAHAICRGFYNAHGDRTLICRLGGLYGVVWVDPENPSSGGRAPSVPPGY